MDPATQVIFSCALTFGAPIAIAGWELWRLGPTSRRLPPDPETPTDPAPLPDAGTSPRIEKALPDCLIPCPAPSRVRELA
jgi:hypothetical protein